MGNINYDSFYKFLVSLGIILVILPLTVLIFLTTNSFDLQITAADLTQYTPTAQKVIAWRQSLPLLIEEKSTWWIIGGVNICGVCLILYGLIKWHELQKIDDIFKKREVEKQKEAIEKSNIMIGTFEYDVVAFANKTFEKDYVYEVKYLKNNISLHQIERYREHMKKLRANFSEELNRLPYMTLAIVVPDKMYEHTVNIAEQIEKWNNYSIEILKESDL